jgi:hypothetical protein
LGLSSIKEINRDIFPQAPQRYKDIKDKSDGLDILKKEILQGEKEVIVKTPITKILFDEKKLEHIVQKDIRAEFAKYIKPTLEEPDEIWAVKIKDKNESFFKKRYRFIKLFKENKENTLAVTELLRDGSVFVTFMKKSRAKQVDDERVGILMYFNKKIFGE